MSRPKVAYYFDSEVGGYTYGPGHPMKPLRMKMTNSLITAYGLHKKMEIVRPDRASFQQMTKFHTDDYMDFLRRVTPETMEELTGRGSRFNVGDDCPVFVGLYEFCQISAGGSIGGASRLNQGSADIAINWSGGLHHAKKTEASGFCYVNDIVLAILELLRYHQRVLYIDIDIHHGDGVEEAFYTTDRVMTCSFHKFGEYFPGTGAMTDVGLSKGRHYSINVPLRDGMNDWTYKNTFEPIITHIMNWYRPGAIVLQMGADSLAGDRLGCFNLSMKGHAACAAFVKTFNVPVLMLGGGGYTIRNVARTWAYETTVMLGEEVDQNLPYNEYFEYYGPDYKLDVPENNMENKNSQHYLDNVISNVIENLRHLPFAPSVQMQEVPRDVSCDEDEDDPDARVSQRERDKRIVSLNEYSDSEDEEETGGTNYERNGLYPGSSGGRRRSEQLYNNINNSLGIPSNSSTIHLTKPSTTTNTTITNTIIPTTTTTTLDPLIPERKKRIRQHLNLADEVRRRIGGGHGGDEGSEIKNHREIISDGGGAGVGNWENQSFEGGLTNVYYPPPPHPMELGNGVLQQSDRSGSVKMEEDGAVDGRKRLLT